MFAAAESANNVPALDNLLQQGGDTQQRDDPSSGPGDDVRSQVSMETHSNDWANPMDDDTTSES